jgi:DNA modification methylase
MTPYYQDESVTLYHGDCREVDAWLAADVLVTDPPYGLQALAGSYGRRNGTIANDMDCTVRNLALMDWGARPSAVFGTPRLPEPPGHWDYRLVWDKVEAGINGGPWRYSHELIFVRGEGWIRLNASSFSILRFPAGNRRPERQDHPHRKPDGLMQTLIAQSPGGVIADPFAGSGQTLVAAARLGRQAIGVELEERYCEVIAKRLSQGVLDFGASA